MSYPPAINMYQHQVLTAQEISPKHFTGSSLHRFDWLIDWLPMWLNSVFRSSDTTWPKASILSDMVCLSSMASPHSKILGCVILYLHSLKKLDAFKVLLTKILQQGYWSTLWVARCIVYLWRWRQIAVERILKLALNINQIYESKIFSSSWSQ